MCESIEQNNGRVELHVRRFQKRIFRVIRVSYRDFRGDLEDLGGTMRNRNQRNMVTWTDSQGSSPVPGNLHAGFQEEGEMITSPPYSTKMGGNYLMCFLKKASISLM